MTDFICGKCIHGWITTQISEFEFRYTQCECMTFDAVETVGVVTTGPFFPVDICMCKCCQNWRSTLNKLITQN